MTKKHIKLAMIRQDDSSPCPFGLSISFGCKSAGNFIDKMAPIDSLGEDSTDEEKAKIAEANNRLLIWSLNGPEQVQKCRYAGQLFPHNDKAVECNVEDSAPGVGQESEIMSPSFSKNFDQPGMVGLLAYPLNYYDDFGGNQNGYYGVYSLQGEAGRETLKKLAERAVDELKGSK